MTIPLAIPVLETERLRLRGPEARDWDGYCAFFTSERAAHVGGPLTRRRAWYALATEIGHWALRGFGMWAVTMKGADRALGMIGCWYPDDWPEREIGWLVYEEAEGKGIAYEAALAARQYAYDVLQWHTAVSYVGADNPRSIRLAERLGAVRDDDATPPETDNPCLVFRHPAPEIVR